MKFCSTLLKVITPINKVITIQIRLYNKSFMLNIPEPKKAYLNVSTIGEIGLDLTRNIYFSGTAFMGYITGVAYIKRPIPKPINKDKSLYLVVKLVIIIPKPNENPAIKITKKGNNRISILKLNETSPLNT